MPKLEGKQMIMMIAPNRKKMPTKAAAGSAQEAAEQA